MNTLTSDSDAGTLGPARKPDCLCTPERQEDVIHHFG